jgi:hypothetical protein
MASTQKPPETIVNTPPAADQFRAPTYSSPAVRPAPTQRLLPNGAIKNRNVGYSKQTRWFNKPVRIYDPKSRNFSRGGNDRSGS